MPADQTPPAREPGRGKIRVTEAMVDAAVDVLMPIPPCCTDEQCLRERTTLRAKEFERTFGRKVGREKVRQMLHAALEVPHD